MGQEDTIGTGPAAGGREGMRSVESAADKGSLVVVQEKVLAEIAHELGNFFHKLYYWSGYLRDAAAKEGAPNIGADATAAEMLERTISNMEEFLKVSLEYFRPVKLSFTKMAVSDLVDGLLPQVRAELNGTPLHFIDGRPWGGATVLVDPMRLSQAVRMTLRRLARGIGEGSSVSVTVAPSQRREFPGLEVTIEAESCGGASPLSFGAEAGVEWAVAQKFVELHGGELFERDKERGGRSAVIFLPLYA